MSTHAGIYARQSLAREDGSEVSTGDQLEKGIALARNIGADHIELYEDLGKSAFKANVVRKDYERMLADCRAGRINYVIVLYVSRFSRQEVLDAVPVVTELLNLGVTIHSIYEGTFTKGNIMDLIHLLWRLDAAHNESKNKSMAVAGVKAAAKSLGGYVGGSAGYGFRLVPETAIRPDGKPMVIQRREINEDEAAVIRRVWRDIKANMDVPFIKGKDHPGSINGLCKRLNEEGVPTRGQSVGKRRKASLWEASTLKRLLLDPAIAGYLAEPEYVVTEDGETTRKVRSYRIVRDEAGKAKVMGEAIIPPAEWWELKAWVEGRGQGKGLARRTSLLSGLYRADGELIMRCECGRPFSALNTAGKANNPVYRCTRPKGGMLPGQHEGGNTITQEHLDDYLALRIFGLIASAEGDPEIGDVLAEAARRRTVAMEDPSKGAERAALVAERAEAAQALQDLAQAVLSAKSAIMQSALMAGEAELLAKLEAADARLADLDATSSVALPFAEWLGEEGGSPIGEGSWWSRQDMDAKRAFVALFLDSVTVSKPPAGRRGGNRREPYDPAPRVTLEWATAPKGNSVPLLAS